MDKNEYNQKLKEITQLVAKEDYEAAANMADTIDWKRVRNVQTLVMISEIYEAVDRYEESKTLLQRAYRRSPLGRTVLYRLVEVTIRLRQFDEAIEYYSEYVKAAPHDNSKYILKYKIYRGRGSSLDEQIAILKEYLEQEYNEKWAYELARLYIQAGRTQEALSTCDDLVLWFHSGKYVTKALELKRKYAPLTPKQQEILDLSNGEAAAAAETDAGAESAYSSEADREKLQQAMEKIAAHAAKVQAEAAQETGAGAAGAVSGAAEAEQYVSGAAGEAGTDAAQYRSGAAGAAPAAAEKAPVATAAQDTMELTPAFRQELEDALAASGAADQAASQAGAAVNGAAAAAGSMASQAGDVAAEVGKMAGSVAAADIVREAAENEPEPAVALGSAALQEAMSEQAAESAQARESAAEASGTIYDSGLNYEEGQLQSELVKSMREIVAGVGRRPEEDPEEALLDEAIERSKEDQEAEVALRGAQKQRAAKTPASSNGRHEAGKLSIDDILLSMGSRGEEMRRLAGGTSAQAEEAAEEAIRSAKEAGAGAVQSAGEAARKANEAAEEAVRTAKEAAREAAQTPAEAAEGMAEIGETAAQAAAGAAGGAADSMQADDGAQTVTGLAVGAAKTAAGAAGIAAGAAAIAAQTAGSTADHTAEVTGATADGAETDAMEAFRRKMRSAQEEIAQKARQASQEIADRARLASEEIDKEEALAKAAREEEERLASAAERAADEEAAKAVQETAQGVADAVREGAAELPADEAEAALAATRVMQTADSTAAGAVNAAAEAGAGAFDAAAGIADTAADAFAQAEDPEEAYGQVAEHAADTAAQAGETAGAAYDAAGDVIGESADEIEDIAAGTIGQAGEAAADAFEQAGETAGAAYDAAGDAIGESADEIEDIAAGTIGQAGEAAADAFEQAGETAGAAGDAAGDVIGESADKIEDIAAGTIGQTGAADEFADAAASDEDFENGDSMAEETAESMTAAGTESAGNVSATEIGREALEYFAGKSAGSGEAVEYTEEIAAAKTRRLPVDEIAKLHAAYLARERDAAAEEAANNEVPAPEFEERLQPTGTENGGAAAASAGAAYGAAQAGADTAAYGAAQDGAAQAGTEQTPNGTAQTGAAQPDGTPQAAGTPTASGTQPDEREVQTEERVEEPRIYGRTPALKEYQKSYFQGFLGIGTLESQIAQAIGQAQSRSGDRTSRDGNILILGAHGSGKTTIATGIARALAEDRGSSSVRMAKIYAADLNRKDIAATIAKIAGGVLIIEEAGDLDDAIVDQLATAMEFRTDGLLVILEDEQRYIHDLLMRHPRFTMKFTAQIYVPEYTSENLVEFGRLYAQKQDYVFSDGAAAALYDRIGTVSAAGETVSVKNVTELVDRAIHNSNGLLRRLTPAKKRFDEYDRIILQEKDFR